MADLKNIELIVFDVDGTLAETDDYYIDKVTGAVCKVFPFLSVDAVRKPIRPVLMTLETIFHGFYRILDLFGLDGLFSKIHSGMSVDVSYKYAPIDGMQGTLQNLSKKYKLAILTSGGRKSTEAFIGQFGISDNVSFILSSEDCSFIKPSSKPLKIITEKASVFPDRCMMVGDTIYDIICAKRAGAISVAVLTGFDSKWFLRLFKPDLLLDSVNDLQKLMTDAEKQSENGISIDKTKDLV